MISSHGRRRVKSKTLPGCFFYGRERSCDIKVLWVTKKTIWWLAMVHATRNCIGNHSKVLVLQSIEKCHSTETHNHWIGALVFFHTVDKNFLNRERILDKRLTYSRHLFFQKLAQWGNKIEYETNIRNGGSRAMTTHVFFHRASICGCFLGYNNWRLLSLAEIERLPGLFFLP